MDTALNASYAVARCVAKIGALLLVVLAGIMFLISIVYVYAFAVIGITESAPVGYWACKLLGIASILSAFVLLAFFFRHIAQENSPFDATQVRRLVISGFAFIAGWLLDYGPRPTKSMLIATKPIPIELSGGAPSLFPLFIGIFILCVAAILRYASALKEDSDSIL